MSVIDKWRDTDPDTLKIDWAAVENELGFEVQDSLRNFYSRITAKQCKGMMKFDHKSFVKKYINRDEWLENANGGAPKVEYELYPLEKTDTEYCRAFFKNMFFGDWTGGNDFGRRILIGELLLNIGQVYLVFNNNTGDFEWVDLEWGYCDVYEDNPYGIVADSAEEFLKKFG